MMELIAGFFALAQSWGPAALTSVLVLVVTHLCRQMNASRKQLDGIAASLRKEFQDQITTLKESVVRQLDEQGRRISYIELEYTKNRDFHRELGGWRAEITRLSDQISSQFMAFTQNIIQMVRGKNE
jgi:hypothetical protein